LTGKGAKSWPLNTALPAVSDDAVALDTVPRATTNGFGWRPSIGSRVSLGSRRKREKPLVQ
jgi:hypothetical protein